jgi:acyl carrier protein
LPFSVNDRGMRALASWLADERISVYSSVTTLFRQLSTELQDGTALPDLRIMKLGGEPVLRSDVAIFERKLHPGCVLLNGLGISEASGNVSFFRHERGAQWDAPTLPLGFAVPGVELWIVDDAGTPQPADTQGEIVVTGSHLSPGYWNRPELTARNFRAVGHGRERAFFTGDVGHLSPDGCLFGAGRKDTALKIRGHHVNTAEVDQALLASAGVAQAATVGRDVAGSFKLIAFVVMTPHATLDSVRVRKQLSAFLPRHMLPARIVTLAALPKLSNGKLDRHALITMPLPPMQHGAGADAPTDSEETQLAVLFCAALKLDSVSVRDDFFELGGDSLDAAAIFANIERTLGVSLALTELLTHPTIEQLARRLRERRHGAAEPVAVALRVGSNSAPFFCIPGAASDAIVFRDLARSLAPTLTFYALQHEGLSGGRPDGRTVESMAARFLSEVLRIQPTGPYYLGGGSFGGAMQSQWSRCSTLMGGTIHVCAGASPHNCPMSFHVSSCLQPAKTHHSGGEVCVQR